jgi:hypothetical protein
MQIPTIELIQQPQGQIHIKREVGRWCLSTPHFVCRSERLADVVKMYNRWVAYRTRFGGVPCAGL